MPIFTMLANTRKQQRKGKELHVLSLMAGDCLIYFNILLSIPDLVLSFLSSRMKTLQTSNRLNPFPDSQT